MKSLLLIPLLLISTNHFAQDKAAVKTELVTNQANHWMTNIATNSQMRLEMMQMMIEHTMDKPDEMRLLVNQILSNPEMKNMIREEASRNVNNGSNSINMPAMMGKNNNVMEKTGKQMKPKIKK